MPLMCGSAPDQAVNKDIEKGLRVDKKRIQSEIKILLLGPGESGKSTIFKQMKIIQEDGGYTLEELREFTYIIYGNCITQMRVLVDALFKMNLEVDEPSNKVRIQRLMNTSAAGDSWSKELARDIKALWSDKGIRQVYSFKDINFQIDDSANYFFDNIDRIMLDDYIPTEDDVLRSRVKTTGIQEAEFRFEDIEFRMLDVGGQRNERRKWIHCFDAVTAVMFCVSLSEYDQYLREDPSQNRMKESLLLFDEVCNSHWFKSTSFILFLNKTDLFKEKIAYSDMTVCFPNYTGGNSFDKGSIYIRDRFLEQNKCNHSIYPHFTCAISTENIEFVFKCVRETVLKGFLKQIIIY